MRMSTVHVRMVSVAFKIGKYYLLADFISGMMVGIEFVDKGCCLDLAIFRLILVHEESNFIEDYVE